jgi:hypothetical protein
MVFQSKRAVSYIGALRGKKATFTSCTGQIRRIVRFRESRPYQLNFDCQLSSGEMSVELLDSDRKRMFLLKNGQKQVTVVLEKGKRYVLIFHFERATGSYSLEWK